MMEYLKVFWKHARLNEPIWLYSELDEARYEIRKIEQFADGSIGYASQTEAKGGSKLSIEPLPTLKEIAEDPQFMPTIIEYADFEKLWQERLDALR